MYSNWNTSNVSIYLFKKKRKKNGFSFKHVYIFQNGKKIALARFEMQMHQMIDESIIVAQIRWIADREEEIRKATLSRSRVAVDTHTAIYIYRFWGRCKEKKAGHKNTLQQKYKVSVSFFSCNCTWIGAAAADVYLYSTLSPYIECRLAFL